MSKEASDEDKAKIVAAIEAGDVEIGNAAVVSRINPYIEIFDNRKNAALTEDYRRAGFVLSWSSERYGFGEVTFVANPDGSVKIDSECMSKDFVVEQLMKMVMNAKEFQ